MIAPIGWWRPDCGDGCSEEGHDLDAHVMHGRLLERQERAGQIVRTGPLTVDLTTETVSVNGHEIRLSRREYDLLAYLARHLGQWRRGEQILAAVWGPEWVTRAWRTRAGAKPTRADTNILNTNRHRLRVRLGPAGVLVETRHRGLGPADMRLARVEVAA